MAPHPSVRYRFATSALVALLTGFLSVSVVPAAVANHSPDHFEGIYVGGAAWGLGAYLPSKFQGVAPYFGAMICAGGVGGACAVDRVAEGDTITAQVSDLVATEISFAVCIDVDGDGDCRPRDFLAVELYGGDEDWIRMYVCGAGTNTLSFTTPVAGFASLFIMEAPGLACGTATTGDWELSISRGGGTPPAAQCGNGVDDDGDGMADLSDPDCTDTSDNSEFSAYTH